MPLDELHKRYIDDIESRYSLGRVFSFFIWTFLFYSFLIIESYDFVEVASTITIAFLFDLESGLLSKVSILHLLFSVGATLFVAKFNNRIKYFIFSTLIELDEKGSDAYEDEIGKELSKVDSPSHSQKRQLEKEIAGGKKAFRRLQGGSEALISLGLGAAIGYPVLAFGDSVLFLIMVASVVYLQWQAYEIYISSIYPYFVVLERGNVTVQSKLKEGISNV